MSTAHNTAAPAGDSPASAQSLGSEMADALARIRAEKQPTRRGILICGQMMAQMLQLGWRADQLDALEITFWLVRDADGRLLSQNK